MRIVYGDSGYWIALQNTRDEWHERAIRITERLGNFRIVTSEMVLFEYMNGVARLGPQSRQLAVATANLILSDRTTFDVVRQTSHALEAAIDRYASRFDQRWSLVDCHSFLIMEERGITDALAYDRDFVQAGFRAILRED